MQTQKDPKRISHYDPVEDVLTLSLKESEEERFEEIEPGVFVEFDKNNRVIGFEILNASRVLKSAIHSLAEKHLAGAAR